MQPSWCMRCPYAGRGPDVDAARAGQVSKRALKEQSAPYSRSQIDPDRTLSHGSGCAVHGRLEDQAAGTDDAERPVGVVLFGLE